MSACCFRRGDADMGGRKSQVKGRNAERELAKLLQGYGYNVEELR